MQNFTFYKLVDPRTEKVFTVNYTEGRLPEVLPKLKADALNNKEKSELDLWILDLMNINRSPLLENLGQKHMLAKFNADSYIEELKKDLGLIKEEVFPVIEKPIYHPYDQENVEEILEEHAPDQVKPYLEDKAKKEEVKKPAAKKRTTKKKATPKKKK